MATLTHGYRTDSGQILDLHPDGVRIATGVFETYVELSQAARVRPSTEEAIARAIVAYNTWIQRFEVEERRAKPRLGRVIYDSDKFSPEGRER